MNKIDLLFKPTKNDWWEHSTSRLGQGTWYYHKMQVNQWKEDAIWRCFCYARSLIHYQNYFNQESKHYAILTQKEVCNYMQK